MVTVNEIGGVQDSCVCFPRIPSENNGIPMTYRQRRSIKIPNHRQTNLSLRNSTITHTSYTRIAQYKSSLFYKIPSDEIIKF